MLAPLVFGVDQATDLCMALHHVLRQFLQLLLLLSGRTSWSWLWGQVQNRRPLGTTAYRSDMHTSVGYPQTFRLGRTVLNFTDRCLRLQTGDIRIYDIADALISEKESSKPFLLLLRWQLRSSERLLAWPPFAAQHCWHHSVSATLPSAPWVLPGHQQLQIWH